MCLTWSVLSFRGRPRFLFSGWWPLLAWSAATSAISTHSLNNKQTLQMIPQTPKKGDECRCFLYFFKSIDFLIRVFLFSLQQIIFPPTWAFSGCFYTHNSLAITILRILPTALSFSLFLSLSLTILLPLCLLGSLILLLPFHLLHSVCPVLSASLHSISSS